MSTHVHKEKSDVFSRLSTSMEILHQHPNLGPLILILQREIEVIHHMEGSRTTGVQPMARLQREVKQMSNRLESRQAYLQEIIRDCESVNAARSKLERELQMKRMELQKKNNELSKLRDTTRELADESMVLQSDIDNINQQIGYVFAAGSEAFRISTLEAERAKLLDENYLLSDQILKCTEIGE
eukprot:PhF_6_TR35778/c0_g1_i2/m.51995